jgi:dihydrofolate reductase
MGKLVASLFVSLDGVVEAPETWHFPYFDDRMGETIGEAVASTGAFVLGRRTFEEWAAYWPGQDSGQSPLAEVINGTPKYVVSTTLEEPGWERSTVLRSLDEVAALTRVNGRDLAVSGSGTLVRSLLDAAVLDELRLMVHPLVVGRGRRLFEGEGRSAPLELVASETFPTGVLSLTYRPQGGGGA